MKNISLIYPIDGIDSPLRTNFQVFDIPPLSMPYMANYPSDLAVTFTEEFQGEMYDYSESDLLCIFFHPRKINRVQELIEAHQDRAYIVLFGLGLVGLDINPKGTNITGEIEAIWPHILEDAKVGEIAKTYESSNGIDLLSLYNYDQLTKYDLEGFDEITPIELQRGNDLYYSSEVDYEVSESTISKEELRNLLIRFGPADNYFFRGYTEDFLRNQLIEEFIRGGKRWGMRLPVSLLPHLREENLEGCGFLMIDTINEEFEEIKLNKNFRVKLIPNMTFKLTSYEQALSLFDSAYEFLSENGLDFAITQLYAPIPGSRAHSDVIDNFIAEKEISSYDGCHQVLFTTDINPEQLEAEYINFVRKYNRFVFRKHTIEAN